MRRRRRTRVWFAVVHTVRVSLGVVRAVVAFCGVARFFGRDIASHAGYHED